MKRGLIGYTGFVGSNLIKQMDFNYIYNSKNIHEIKNMVFDELYFCGLPAEKWKINKDPKSDLKNIIDIIGFLRKIVVKKFILISTIDVYQDLNSSNENSLFSYNNHHSYGVNRRIFENFISENFENHHIIRLPGLFGKGLKKNIIFDFLTNNEIQKIDSRNVFQFYNLSDLSNDIKTTISHNVSIINFSTEPISVEEVYRSLFNKSYKNITSNTIINYNIKSIYYQIFNGENGYLKNKKHILNQLRSFNL
jgi:hypothetical protein